jgi:hypothetical protein
MKKILLLQRGDGRRAQQKKIEQRVQEAGYSLKILEIEKKKDAKEGFSLVEQIEKWVSKNGKPVATIRWDEHGNVFGKDPKVKEISSWGWQNGVAPIAVDFCYFNHYSGFILDLLDSGGNSSIKREWDELDSDLIPIVDFQDGLGSYIKLVKRIYEKHDYFKSLRHTTANYEIAAWTQCLVNNCRLLKTNEPDVWMSALQEMFGSSVLFKLQPSPFNNKEINLDKFRVMHTGGAIKIMNQAIEQNASVAANARVNITNTSGVTSELLIAKKPIITTGESWFSGLGVFYEPKNWGELKHMVDNVITDEIPDDQAYSRLKLANWWRKHQSLHNEKSELIANCIKEFKEKT